MFRSRLNLTHCTQFAGIMWLMGNLLYGGGNIDCLSGFSYLYASGSLGCGITSYGELEINEGNVFTNGMILCATTGGRIRVREPFAAINNTANPIIDVQEGGTIIIEANAWGTGNTSAYPVVIHNGGSLQHSGGHILAIDGASTEDVSVGGTGKTFAEAATGFVNTTNLARSVIST